MPLVTTTEMFKVFPASFSWSLWERSCTWGRVRRGSRRKEAIMGNRTDLLRGRCETAGSRPKHQLSERYSKYK